MSKLWVYNHQDLGEPPHVDGSPICRPVVPLVVVVELLALLGVLDSGSPISVANADLFTWMGVDVDATGRCTRCRSALEGASSERRCSASSCSFDHPTEPTISH